MKSKGCNPVNTAIGRFKWTVEAQRTWQIGNQGSQGHREAPRSLQWTDPVYEGDGRSNLRKVVCCEGLVIPGFVW